MLCGFACQVEEGASLVFNSTDAALYKLWVGEALPTYPAGLDAGGPLRYRAHLDCDGCRSGSSCSMTAALRPHGRQHPANVALSTVILRMSV